MVVLFAFVGVIVGYPKLDAMMGLGVAALMLYSAYKVARNAIDDLLGKPVDLETIANIKLTAMKVKGVLNIHDIVTISINLGMWNNRKVFYWYRGFKYLCN